MNNIKKDRQRKWVNDERRNSFNCFLFKIDLKITLFPLDFNFDEKLSLITLVVDILFGFFLMFFITFILFKNNT